MSKNIVIKTTYILLILTTMLFILTSCGGSKNTADLSSYPSADMSGYAGLSSYDKELKFREVTTADVFNMMDEGKSFVLFTSFSECPWCNAMISYLNDVALEKNADIAYIDTRKNPAWKSNVDIDGYDEFVNRFGDYLALDENDKPHLYVPDFFVIEDGKVVYEHQGLVPSVEDPQDEMTDEEIRELKKIYSEGIGKIK